MKIYFEKYRYYFSNKRFLASVTISFLLLFAGLIINFYAGTYATEKASNSVTDIILDNVPVVNVDEIFLYGPLLFWFVIALLCLDEPKRIPFVLKNIALFVLIRSIFISLTHIGPFPDHIIIDSTSRLARDFIFGGDLFFSGHTGLPFLMALVFQKNIRLRILFILTAIFFGVIVLMAHLHYSIDVVSAFFITYTIYHIAKFLFKEDEKIFNSGLESAQITT